MLAQKQRSVYSFIQHLLCAGPVWTASVALTCCGWGEVNKGAELKGREVRTACALGWAGGPPVPVSAWEAHAWRGDGVAEGLERADCGGLGLVLGMSLSAGEWRGAEPGRWGLDRGGICRVRWLHSVVTMA